MLPLWYNPSNATQRSQSQCFGYWIIRVDHTVNSSHKFVDVYNFVQMFFTLLANSENPDSQKIAAHAENISQLQQRRVYQYWKGVLLEEPGKPHDGFALFSDLGRTQPYTECTNRYLSMHSLGKCTISRENRPLSSSMRAVLASCSGSPPVESLNAFILMLIMLAN